jgi:hypothetical protein
MKLLPIALASIAVLPFLQAGQLTEIPTNETGPSWSAELSTGWDSLYMYRGVNQVPGFDDYGSSLSWTALSWTLQIGENDALSLGTWAAFSMGETDYKEIDAVASYTHTVGAFSLTFGYALYAVINEPNGLFNNELNVTIGYDFDLGFITLTPGLEYAFNVGPKPGQGGYSEQASSYLEIRLDGDMAIYRDKVALAPWAALGVNFRNNTTLRDEEASPFTGADHFEVGAALPFSVAEGITLSPYAAVSMQWSDFPGTQPTTFWGGVSVNFSF